MKQSISLALNVVFAVAIAILFYLHFSSTPATNGEVATADSTAAVKPVILTPKEIKGSKIVYVNLDVLNENYEYIKEVNATAKRELSALEGQYQKKAQKLQEDYMSFQQQAQGGQLSDNQIAAKEQELTQRKEELDQLELKSQDMMEKMQQRSEEMNISIKDYLKEYNKTTGYNFVMAYSISPQSPVLIANDSLDITQEILDGLNAQYKASKKATK